MLFPNVHKKDFGVNVYFEPKVYIDPFKKSNLHRILFMDVEGHHKSVIDSF